MAQPSAPLPPPYETQQQQPGYAPYPPDQGGYAPGGYMPVPSQSKLEGVPPQGYVGGGYVPPQPGYPQPGYTQPGYAPVQQPMPQAAVVVVTQPSVMGAVGPVSPMSMTVTCPRCRQTVSTNVSYDMGLLAWLICLLLFFLGVWPCCLIPLCCTDCQDATHHCPACNAFIGQYKRL